MQVPAVTARGAVWITAISALAVYVHATANGWALDDFLIVANNDTAHTMGNALRGFFSPYWDPAFSGSGQYRPLVILMFSLDWVVSGGSTIWFHAVNVLWHVVVSVLAVFVLRRWLPPLGAMTAGVVFAVHPVHVEAVANIVGRSEMVVAAAILAAVLAARRYRAAPNELGRAAWALLASFLVLCAMFTKENGVVGIGVIAADHWVSNYGSFRRNAGLYAVVGAVTLGWLFLWAAIAGEFVGASEAAAFRGFSTGERLATVAPLQLEVLRLLVWPFELASDYNPRMFRIFKNWTSVPVFSAVVCVAVVALAFLAKKRAPAVALGLLVALMAYSPTSNILFGSGVALAERNLYLAVLAPASVAAFLLVRFLDTTQRHTAILVAAGFGVALSIKTVIQVPVWRDGETLLIQAYLDHPENYRTKLRISNLYSDRGRLSEALAETMAASALYPDDPFLALWSVPRALELNRYQAALKEAERAYALMPDEPLIAELVIRVHLHAGTPGSAVQVARRIRERRPESAVAASFYTRVLDSLNVDNWRLFLAKSREHWVSNDFIQAGIALDSAIAAFSAPDADAESCWDVQSVWPMIRRLNPMAARVFDERMLGAVCDGTETELDSQ